MEKPKRNDDHDAPDREVDNKPESPPRKVDVTPLDEDEHIDDGIEVNET